MKKVFFLFAFVFVMISCNKKSEVEKKIEEIPVTLKLSRFEKLFFETKPEELSKLKVAYPEFFPQGVPDSVWINKMTHPLWIELYEETQKKYSDFDAQKSEIELVFKHAKFYFPNTRMPEIITVISEMDYNNKVIYNGDYLLIALELYLGKDHEFYRSEFPAYIRQNFEASQIIPDVVTALTNNQVPEDANKNLLSQMIFAGKELYIKDLLMPDYSDADKIGYTPEQIKWCQDNESYMWRYFIEESLLYDTDPKLGSRFIHRAPFSKFYLEIDNESPGRVGTWIGWQIVRAYAENNKIDVKKLLTTDATTIFNNSKYKPKK
ncbi:gliding motility lipoprotein GldB [Flavobacterium sp.]|uniref:gliding motility lipoprotein GldB n=1 Tax=Flavobacterium sp. TaxID=239 RepID=UPI002628E86A|nr:gliding motility lipoprotein GldB [Flavobacterium sp.]MDD3004846.1 gliding motility lipoprotein GldB [Flavobacterium sp.]